MKKDIPFIGILIGLAVLFVLSPTVFKVFEIEIFPAQFVGALIGVFITIVVTALLLRGQTEGEEKREKSVKVFEKKQEVYHNFIDKLQEIIQDGEIHIGTKAKDGSLDSSVDELKDLIFQFAYLQLHTSKDTIIEVIDKVSELIQHLNTFSGTPEVDKQKKLPEYYANLSTSIFKIASILKDDLYTDEKQKKNGKTKKGGKTNIEDEPIKKEKMRAVLQECNLFVETEGLDKYILQKYFWDELRKKLNQKYGYNIEDKEHDFMQDINKYYARARNRHRWYGFQFLVYESEILNRKIFFRVEIGNTYYYGFKKQFENQNIMNCISDRYTKTSSSWFGYKFSDRFNLDFWKMPTEQFAALNDNKRREQFMEGIADEIHGYVEEFIKKAKQNNL